MFRSILVPVDGSELSSRAVALAVQVARLTNARLIFAHVVNVGEEVERLEAPFVDPERAIDELKDAGEKVLSETLASLEVSELIVETQQIEGEPVQGILDVANERACDLIVMGSHGRRGLARLLLGSVTEGVLRNSHVPVLCVPAESHAT